MVDGPAVGVGPAEVGAYGGALAGELVTVLVLSATRVIRTFCRICIFSFVSIHYYSTVHLYSLLPKKILKYVNIVLISHAPLG